MRHTLLHVLAFVLGGLALTACKPSEKNYRAAYEAALEKQRRADEALGVDPAVINRIGGPVKMDVGGQTVFTEAVIVAPADTLGEASGNGPRGVALARFSMPVNARAIASDLRPEFPGVFIARDGSDKWYVILSRCPDNVAAARIISDFCARRPDFPYIGLPGVPVVVDVR